MTGERENDLHPGGPDRAEGGASAEQHGDRMRRHLTGSIYLWACGEKSARDVEDITLSDILIGWLVALLQGLAYVMLIVRAERSESSTSASGGNSNNSNYSMASVTGAMYLLVASTTPDLRAGFSLLVDGLHPYHHVFGFALLTLYGVMICAALKVLFTAADDDTSVVINAVTVLFIADVDEKALSFFATVPQRWRLFWAIYTVGISFALALVGLIHVGDASVTVDVGGDNILDGVPGWFVWAVNPGAVTACSFYLSAAVRAFAEACCEADDEPGVPKWRMISVMVLLRCYKVVGKARDFMQEEPGFGVVLWLWLAHGAVSWWFLLQEFWGPLGMCSDSGVSSTINSTGSASSTTATSSNTTSSTVSSADSKELYASLIIASVALAAGFMMKMLGICMRGKRRPRTVDEPLHSSEVLGSAPRQCCGKFDCALLPSLLFGWGVGYWITSVLMGGSLHSGGWSDTPLALKIVGYITIPWFFLAVIFLMADPNFLGARFEPFLQYTRSTLGDKHGVWFWILATVIRDVLSIWVFMWYVLVPCLNNI